jgi:beta-galactosidase
MPGRLREAAGATYGEYTNLGVPIPVRGEGIELPAGASATAWADALVSEGADTLVAYEHPHLGRWPAVTTHGHGEGRVTYVGTLPDRSLAVALGGWLRNAPDLWAERAETVTVTAARNRRGETVWFVSNWSWEPASVTVPAAVKDLLSDDELRAKSKLSLGAWDVRVLVERIREENNEEGRPLE